VAERIIADLFTGPLRQHGKSCAGAVASNDLSGVQTRPEPSHHERYFSADDRANRHHINSPWKTYEEFFSPTRTRALNIYAKRLNKTVRECGGFITHLWFKAPRPDYLSPKWYKTPTEPHGAEDAAKREIITWPQFTIRV